MILENLVTFIGALLKHIIGVLLLCWRRMLRAGLIAFAIGVVVTVLIVVLGTGQAIPSAPSLVVALLMGLGLAYGVALTVLIEEMVLGAIDLIRMIEGDISAGAHIAEVIAEREVGQVGQGLRRLIGLPVSKRAPARPGAALPSLTPVRPQGQPVRYPARQSAPSRAGAGAAVAAGAAVVGAAAIAATAPRAATVEKTNAPGALDPTSEPVPAGRLPRIPWTYDDAIHSQAATSQAAAPAIDAALAPFAPARVAGSFAPPSAIMPPTPDTPETPTTPNMPDIPEAPTTPITPDVPAEPETLPPPEAPTAPDVPAEPLPTPEEPAEPETPATPEVPEEPETPAEPETPEAPALEAAYEDERLTAPASIATPEGPAEPAERVDDDTEEDTEAAPIQPAPEWAGSSTGAPVEAGTAVVAGGIPVPAPAPSTIPLGDEIADTQPVAVVEARQPADTQPVAVVDMRQPADTQPVATVDASHAAGPEAPSAAPAGRSDFARRTLPLSDAGALLDGPRDDLASATRPNAPESGLWERLSNALISRAGAPSGPFASAPPLTSDEPAADGAPREPGADGA